jgi:hypothetical protein
VRAARAALHPNTAYWHKILIAFRDEFGVL